jgi:hypothetical protein
MNSYPLRLATILILAHFSASAQRLKKADRTIGSNMHNHISFLSGQPEKQKGKASAKPETSEVYISRQFAASGLKPDGDDGSWFQKFEIFDGKEIQPSTYLSINNNKLKLYEEYFPLAFSANEATKSAVAIALAENGVPWFKDLKEILAGSEDSASVDTLQLIRSKAMMAAQKGATALIVYNSDGNDIIFNKYDRSQPVSIPVVYVTKKTFKKYFPDESAIVDIALDIKMNDKTRTGMNVIGFDDNRADSTTFINTYLGQDTALAALMEMARLLKNQKKKNHNYLFVAYCGDKNGNEGANYLHDHPTVNFRKVNDTLKLDTVTVAEESPKELHLVKRSLEIISNN